MKSTTKRFLRKPEILKITGVSANTLWVWTMEGTFPMPYKLSHRSVGWADNEVEEWISKRQKVTYKGSEATKRIKNQVVKLKSTKRGEIEQLLLKKESNPSR